MTQKETEEHAATHVQFRDWFTHCMIHHHVTKQKSEDQSRNPTIAMDYYFMKMSSVVNAQTMSDESVTCIAVNQDRNQNIMSSVALKKEDLEPCTVESGEINDLLGHRLITLKQQSRCQQSLRSEAVWQKCAKQKSQQRMQ